MSELQIRNNLGTVLTSLNWKEGFIAVDGEKHWEEGRSAERLANDFSSKVPSSGECSLRDILMSFLHEDKIIWKKATIEHGSQFDSYARPRMQDLAIWGNAGNKAFFIGVEAKVDEPFGSKNIAEQKKYINRILASGKNTNADKRLYELCEDFLGGLEDHRINSLRYQLLYYLAGSFRENADYIIMPVFTYHSDKFDKIKGEQNYSDYCYFMDHLGFQKLNLNIANLRIAYYKHIDTYDKDRVTILSKDVYSCYFEK